MELLVVPKSIPMLEPERSDARDMKGYYRADCVVGSVLDRGSGWEIHGFVTWTAQRLPILPVMSDSGFSYTSTPGQKDGTVIVKLSGPLTLSTIFDLQADFRSMNPEVLILDLSGSSYMDSAGLGVIMNKYVSAEHSHRKFLLAGVNGRIEALMELTKVKRILHIYPTVEEAEASV